MIHIQDSMLMRIIIKRCRVGTSLLQSAPQQKQEGQRKRVRKAALLNALLDPISFGHFQHQAKPNRVVSFHKQAILLPHCNVSGLSKSLLDFTVALKTLFSLRTAKSSFSKFNNQDTRKTDLLCIAGFLHFGTLFKLTHLTLRIGIMFQNFFWHNFQSKL